MTTQIPKLQVAAMEDYLIDVFLFSFRKKKRANKVRLYLRDVAAHAPVDG